MAFLNSNQNDVSARLGTSHVQFLDWLHSDAFLPQALVNKYGVTGPRYTSYPTAPVWNENFTADHYTRALQENNRPGAPQRELPLSIYTHLPFCEERCLFCGCNVVITKQKEQAEKYLTYLLKEIEMTTALVDASRPVVQYHWGGGTPTYMTPEQLSRVFNAHQQRLTFAEDAEISIEVDPRVTTTDHIQTLRELGFNRISMGVQDFDPLVQQSVKRIQPVDMTAGLVESCRKAGFSGINLDLIYGLPNQSVVGFEKTLRELLTIRPDRIALYNYAHVPWISPHQKAIDEAALPDGETKLQIFKGAITRMLDAGYVYIGMDHFALPQDELSQAVEDGTLHRNFMGYTTRAGQSEMLAFGVSGIGALDRHYVQNLKKLSTYYQAIEENTLPVWRGMTLSDDDLLRRAVIQQILCQGYLRFEQIEQQFDIDFQEYFKEPLEQLAPLAADQLLTLDEAGLALTPLGRILSRNVAMPFDAYLQKQKQEQQLFSKTV